MEGLQSVSEALLSPYAPDCLLCNQRGMEAMEAYADVIRDRSIACYSVTDEVIATLAGTVTPQGVIAVMPLVHVDLDRLLGLGPSIVLVANRVRDPGNLGNMIRIADAAGAEGMVIGAESVDLYNPKTVRSSAGSVFHLPLAVREEVPGLVQRLKRDGYTVLAASPHAGTGMWEMRWPGRMALVMGNEAWGMPAEEEALVDGLVRIPLFGKAESLNVAAATAVLLYEVRRQRAHGGSEGVDG